MQSEAQATAYQPVNLGVFQKFSQAWLSCMAHVLVNGHSIMDGEAQLREVLNVSLTARSCSESEFISAGADESRLQLMLRKYRSQSILPEYHISYGRLFRDHANTDQIQWLVTRLRGNPNSKSATIGFHVPGEHELSCISLLDCKLRDGALNVTAIYRSQNVYASQPGNVCALHDLQREIAGDLHVSVGLLTLHIMSAHIYQNDWRKARDIVSRHGNFEPVAASDSFCRSREG